MNDDKWTYSVLSGSTGETKNIFALKTFIVGKSSISFSPSVRIEALRSSANEK